MDIDIHQTKDDRNKHLRKKNLTLEERIAICNWLLARFNGHKLEKNSISKAATKFGVSLRTISTIWKRIRVSMAEGNGAVDIASRKKGNSGRKRKDWTENLKLIENRSGTLRSLSSESAVPKTTLFRLLKRGNTGSA